MTKKLATGFTKKLTKKEVAEKFSMNSKKNTVEAFKGIFDVTFQKVVTEFAGNVADGKKGIREESPKELRMANKFPK